MKKTLKIIAIVVAVLLIIGLLFVANAFVGNPISKMIVTNNAKEYIEETYPDTDYYVDSVNYNFKTTKYYANVKSPSSKDTSFTLSYSMLGNAGYDSFSSRVSDGFNTWDRINNEYRTITAEIIENLPYESDVNYGEIQILEKGNSMINFGLDMSTLELDKVYDIDELGSKYGKITLYVYVDEVTAEKASEVLVEVKKQFDKEKLSFYAIDLVLRLPRNKEVKDWQDTEKIHIESFLYSDIVDDNLLEKVNASIIATENYYDEMDKKEIEQSKNE